MDRRTLKTRAAIYEAFSSLLAEKTYSKITIQEIIDRADIGRSTFYSHFETKEDLLFTMCKDIFDHIFLNKNMIEKTHNFSANALSPRTMITHILYHIKENERTMKGILGSESGDIFMRYFKGYLNDQMKKFILNFLPEDNYHIPKDFLLNHITGSFIEMVDWWVKNNMKQTPEDLTEYYLAVIFPIAGKNETGIRN
jgi:AcrR family transcriptional regulator